MRIYLKTSYSGYCWCDAYANKIFTSQDADYHYVQKCETFAVDMDKSLVIFSQNHELCLMLGFTSGKDDRIVDSFGRSLYVKLAIILEDNAENRNFIRRTAIKWLENEIIMRKIIIDSISMADGSDTGFSVDASSLESKMLEAVNDVMLQNEANDGRCMCAKAMTQSSVERMTEALKNQALPNREGISVLLVSITVYELNDDALRREGIWRAICHRSGGDEAFLDLKSIPGSTKGGRSRGDNNSRGGRNPEPIPNPTALERIIKRVKQHPVQAAATAVLIIALAAIMLCSAGSKKQEKEIAPKDKSCLPCENYYSCRR